MYLLTFTGDQVTSSLIGNQHSNFLVRVLDNVVIWMVLIPVPISNSFNLFAKFFLTASSNILLQVKRLKNGIIIFALDGF